MIDPHTRAEWDAYRALPEWEVTVQVSRTARFRAHAATPEEAQSRVTAGQNGVQSMGDLYDAGELVIDHVISVEAIS